MKINIIPTPKGISGGNKILFLEPSLCHGDFDPQAEMFASEMAGKYGINLAFAENGIKTVKCDLLHEREYRLEVNGNGITVFAADGEGASYAFVSLLQITEVRDGKLMLPDVTVTDEPDCKYRGLLLDCARSFHTLDELKKYVDLCRFYKIKYLHIHFSDDESYTLPSEKFPKLPTEGRCFTFAEIAELDEYSAARNVSIVPEVDTPGHSCTLQRMYPEVFGDRGIISFCERAISAVGEIYGEVCAMFPHSEYVHIGGDESRLGWWLEWDECTEFGKECGFSYDDEVEGISKNEYIMLRYLAYFIKRNAEKVLSCGKKPLVWEGFHKCTDDIVPKEATVMIFDSSYQLPHELIEAGFDVVNCAWFPTYIVTPTWFYSEEECFGWDIRSYGTINDQSPYKNGVMKFPYSEKMVGGQLSSWGDTIERAFPTKEDGHIDEMKKIRERLPYISENTWNIEKRTEFYELSRRITDAEKILDK